MRGAPLSEIAELPMLRAVQPTINVIQWDGRHSSANGVAAALGVLVDEIGADVTHAKYHADTRSAGTPVLQFEIAREDDGSAWRADLHQGDWLAVWVLDGRLVAVDVYSESDGNDRFVRIAPVITIRPRLGQ